jgi:wyosine [tRNA(Phe)-imidazoG37] synthetase (radical SAM superfamily)
MIIYGPVPSRRLGRSLGINNITSKVCSYACIYCQAGRTTRLQTARKAFFNPEKIAAEVAERLEKLRESGEKVDYLSFVPNGEPTIDANLGRTIEVLKTLGTRIAVITNASLLWRADVREELAKADWVSVKVDTVRERVWHALNRPHPSLCLHDLLEGILLFAATFQGELETETMLVRDMNDSESDLEMAAEFIARLKPVRARLAAPIRPPAEARVEAPSEHSLNRAFQIYREHGIPVELLVGFEGSAFSATGNTAENLLAITAVHPMREDAVREFLTRTNRDWQTVRDLIDKELLIEVEYRSNRFYMVRSRGRSTS